MDRSPEDELRYGVIEALRYLPMRIQGQKTINKRSPDDRVKVSSPKSAWINPNVKRRHKPNTKLGNRKPSLGHMADEHFRSKEEQEFWVGRIAETLPPDDGNDITSTDINPHKKDSVDKAMKPLGVSMKDLKAVLWIMSQTASASQRKLMGLPKLPVSRIRALAPALRHVPIKKTSHNNHSRIDILS